MSRRYPRNSMKPMLMHLQQNTIEHFVYLFHFLFEEWASHVVQLYQLYIIVFIDIVNIFIFMRLIIY